MNGLLAAAAGAAATYAAMTGGVSGAVGGAGGGAASAEVSTRERATIEQIVHDYILAHPEILPQAMEKLQARDTAKAIAANRALIETPFAGAWDGAKDGDVVLVEFFDYACGYCRAALPDIERLLREDRRLKIVYRELPVLGPDSVSAAHVSLAVAGSGRYPAFHRALYAAGRPSAAVAEQVARRFGVVAVKPTAVSREEIAVNLQLQSALRLSGTPTWIVGDRMLNGAVGYDALKAAVAEARARR